MRECLKRCCSPATPCARSRWWRWPSAGPRCASGPGWRPAWRRPGAVVEQAVREGRVVYGITTGFGALANTRIDPALADEAQVALLRSHAAGVGPPLPDPLVRAMLLLRARTLAQGHSGVRVEIVARLLDLLRLDLLPVVPAQGSVGASGRPGPLCPSGAAADRRGVPAPRGAGAAGGGGAGRARPGPADAARQGGPQPAQRHRGHAGHGGARPGTGRGAWPTPPTWPAPCRSRRCWAAPGRSTRGSTSCAPTPVRRRRRPPCAATWRAAASGPATATTSATPCRTPTACAAPPRCTGRPATCSASPTGCWRWNWARWWTTRWCSPRPARCISGGNFHGQPLAFALDFATVAVTELSSISERRTDRILDPVRSAGLPPFLATRPGLNSGYMVTQYIAAALVAENRVLCHPASIESIPTSGSQEDHVSMGWGAGRKLGEVLANAARVDRGGGAVRLRRHRVPPAPGPGAGTGRGAGPGAGPGAAPGRRPAAGARHRGGGGDGRRRQPGAGRRSGGGRGTLRAEQAGGSQ